MQFRRFLSTIRYTKYPKELFLQPLNTSNRYAVTFIESEKLPVGWWTIKNDSKSEAALNDRVISETDILPGSFNENEKFNAMALNQREGWLNINDSRVFVPWGRVGDPEDIFGSIQLQKGEIVAGSYQRLSTHRLLSINGLFQLSDYLHDKMVISLENYNE
ncbi:hypothetical protein HK096_004097 [Nowakowskiella sp. JEL0078]|nr:hypothetical protein HK096_004097 [Nowakowskiella sp. JEL0078]